ncbi:beta-ketoacyl-[acyl-carrier-protein] synthase family protein [Streptomyces sp. NPDC048331]|uniref:beta-ketoacyl-[acyl-carrier-protein] synthase family protein n=1 Tax=Streptomyces sp. NPDC048331 TaxID=3365534 RepID=UPI00371D1042
MRRVVITGIGVVAPGGGGTRGFWSLLTSGYSATRAVTSFDARPMRSRVAAEIDFDPGEHGLSARQGAELARVAQFALVGAREALADSGAAPSLDPLRTGVALGSALGCAAELSLEYAVASHVGARWLVDHTRAVPQLYDYFVPGSLAAEVARDAGAQGPVSLVAGGCTAGLDAVGHGADLIREGSADVVLAGAAEAPISPVTMACCDTIRVTSRRNAEPRSAARPFDRTRDGFVLGEGAAVLVLEEAERARRRGARVYAEVAGYASRSGAAHMTGLSQDGADLAEAIGAALDEARLDPSAVESVSAHGSGTWQSDLHETAAIKRALGRHAYRVPVSAITSMTGYPLGAVGAFQAAAGALTIEHATVPPTAHLRVPDPECDLDYVPGTAREQHTSSVLALGSGFGGLQSALVLTRPEPDRPA